MEPKTSFLFDRMLGRLCRKMRLLGFDSKLNPESEQGRFHLNADGENRLAVTVSQRKTDRPGSAPLILESRGTYEQVVELLGSFDTIPELKPFTRCLECNRILEDLPKDQARGRVPEDILSHFDSYKICPKCERIYWKGSHYEAMSKTLAKIEKRLKGAGK